MKKHDSKVVNGREVPKSKLNKTAFGAAVHATQSGISLNREQRRSLAKSSGANSTLFNPQDDNCVWDELNEKSNVCSTLLTGPAAFLPLLRNTELISLVENKVYLNELAAQLGRDLVTYNDFYMGIRNAHVNRTGSSTDADDHLKAISIFNDYVIFTEQYNGVVVPLVQALTELIVPAERLLREKNQKAHDELTSETHQKVRDTLGLDIKVEESAMTPEQNPNVITDVEVKTESVH